MNFQNKENESIARRKERPFVENLMSDKESNVRPKTLNIKRDARLRQFLISLINARSKIWRVNGTLKILL